jgi:hypothetical protein
MGVLDFGAFRYIANDRMGQLPTKRTPTFDELRENWAIASIQRRLKAQGFDPKRDDGVFHWGTGTVTKRFQRSYNLRPFDSMLGLTELRRLFTRMVFKRAEVYAVPGPYLWGLVFQESGFDPSATGYINPNDHGLMQINALAHPSITDERAFNAEFAVGWGAERLGSAHEEYVAKPHIAWHCAIANHNSPVKADLWFKTGVPPLDEGETAPGQIERYVTNVMTHWERFGSPLAAALRGGA